MEKEITKTNYQKRKEICKTKKFCKISKALKRQCRRQHNDC